MIDTWKRTHTRTYRYIEPLQFSPGNVPSYVYFQAEVDAPGGSCQSLSVVRTVKIIALTDPRYERPSNMWQR
ncbi:MAG: hypothetical protein U1E76_07125 [Planctomycetota bacterium]